MSLTGLVLCGGKSSRLGMDKAQISYHGQPQWLYTARLLTSLCDRTLVSCSSSQATTFRQELNPAETISLCIDSDRFGGKGPMSGVLSAFEKYPGEPMLVVGCDYPLLTRAELESLIHARASGFQAVCHHIKKDDLDLPFPALYEAAIYPALQRLFSANDFSLRTALKIEPVIRLEPPHPEHLVSADTLEQVRHMQQIIAKRS